MGIIITTTVCLLLFIAVIGVVGYFAYRYGHDKGYKEAEVKYKQPTLTTEQQEVKQKREKVEDHFNRLFAYSPTRR